MSAVSVDDLPTLAHETAAREGRAELARRVLARAEERTGASRWVPPVRVVPPPSVDSGTADTPHLARPSSSADVEPAAEARVLPVPPGLAGLLPAGALVRGTTVAVQGSTSLTLALLAEVSRAGGWVALVGLPEVGLLAAHGLGLDLDRVVLVPRPGPDGPTVVAALLDGVDAVVAGPAVALAPADHRRLSARARERGAVLLSTTDWPGAHVVLAAEESRWDGLGRGHGRLRSRRLVVRRAGRGSAAREHRAAVVLHGEQGEHGEHGPGDPVEVPDGRVAPGQAWPPAQGWRAG